MLYRNRNRNDVIKYADKKQRFSLRKLSVGVASVLLGVTFAAYGTSSVAHAAEPAQTAAGEQAQTQPASEPAKPAATTPATKAAPAEQSEPAPMQWSNTTHFVRDGENGPVLHAPVTQTGAAGQPLDKSQVDAAVNQILNAHPELRVDNDGFHSKSVFAADTVNDYIIFTEKAQATGHESINGRSVASRGVNANYAIDGDFQGWTTATFDSQNLNAPTGQRAWVHGVTVTPVSGRTPEFNSTTLARQATTLQNQLRSWSSAHPYPESLPEFTIDAPLDVNFQVQYVPVAEAQRSITVNFIYLPNPDEQNGTEVHPAVTIHGFPGDSITATDRTEVQNVIDGVLRAHPDWYLHINGFGMMSTFMDNNPSVNVFFASVQHNHSTESVTLPDGRRITITSGTQTAVRDSGSGFLNHWTTGDFARYNLTDTVPTGYHRAITVQVTPVAAPAGESRQPYTDGDRTGRTLAQYATLLQSHLQQWLTANPNATALPAFTTNGPLNVSFTVTHVRDTDSAIHVRFIFDNTPGQPGGETDVHPEVTIQGPIHGAIAARDRQSVHDAISAVRAAHPDWYVHSNNFAHYTIYPAPNEADTVFIYFYKVQHYTSHEYVNNAQVAQQALNAEYDQSGLETGDGYQDWTPAAFASQTLTVPAGYHVVIRGVRVTAAPAPTDDDTKAYVDADRHGQRLSDYAAALQGELSRWAAAHPNATALPTYTVNAPMDVRWDVELVADTPDQPDNPQPDNPPVTPNKPDKPNKPETPDKKPDKPNKPGTPHHNVPGQPNKPAQPGQSTTSTKPGQSTALTPVVNNANNAARPVQTSSKPTAAKQAVLPQTGTNKAGLFGLALAAILAAFGLAPQKKHEN